MKNNTLRKIEVVKIYKVGAKTSMKNEMQKKVVYMMSMMSLRPASFMNEEKQAGEVVNRI